MYDETTKIPTLRADHFIRIDVDERRGLVSLYVSDAAAVEAALDPFMALQAGEDLINAALATYIPTPDAAVRTGLPGRHR